MTITTLRATALASDQIPIDNLEIQQQMSVVERERCCPLVKVPYQADQQVKFLHLQAEVDSLLKQLQAMKQQRQNLPAPQRSLS